jgi:hypothetical protein
MAFCATEHTSRFERRVKVIQVRPAVDLNDCILDSYDSLLELTQELAPCFSAEVYKLTQVTGSPT